MLFFINRELRLQFWDFLRTINILGAAERVEDGEHVHCRKCSSNPGLYPPHTNHCAWLYPVTVQLFLNIIILWSFCLFTQENWRLDYGPCSPSIKLIMWKLANLVTLCADIEKYQASQGQKSSHPFLNMIYVFQVCVLGAQLCNKVNEKRSNTNLFSSLLAELKSQHRRKQLLWKAA